MVIGVFVRPEGSRNLPPIVHELRTAGTQRGADAGDQITGRGAEGCRHLLQRAADDVADAAAPAGVDIGHHPPNRIVSPERPGSRPTWIGEIPPRSSATRASTSGGRPVRRAGYDSTSVPCTCRANTSCGCLRQCRMLLRLRSTRSGASPTLKLVLRERYGVRLQPPRRVNTACRSSVKSFRFGNCARQHRCGGFQSRRSLVGRSF